MRPRQAQPSRDAGRHRFEPSRSLSSQACTYVRKAKTPALSRTLRRRKSLGLFLSIFPKKPRTADDEGPTREQKVPGRCCCLFLLWARIVLGPTIGATRDGESGAGLRMTS